MFTNIDGTVCDNRNSINAFCFSPQNDFQKNATLYFRARRFGFPSARPAKKLLSAGKDKWALGGMKIDS